jgi:hypothetical protein
MSPKMSPESALTKAEQKYQKANIDVAIQQHLTACAAEQSEEQFVSFIMSTDIGLFIFLPLAVLEGPLWGPPETLFKAKIHLWNSTVIHGIVVL